MGSSVICLIQSRTVIKLWNSVHMFYRIQGYTYIHSLVNIIRCPQFPNIIYSAEDDIAVIKICPFHLARRNGSRKALCVGRTFVCWLVEICMILWLELNCVWLSSLSNFSFRPMVYARSSWILIEGYCQLVFREKILNTTMGCASPKEMIRNRMSCEKLFLEKIMKGID